MMHETNTYNREETPLAAFRPLYGTELFEHRFWRGDGESTGGIVETLQAEGVEVIPSIHAVAMISGPVAHSAYAEIKRAALAAIREAGPLDGVCFCLHGAMYTDGEPDPEGDLMAAIREAVGPGLPIVVTLDMHASVSDRLVRSINACAVFRTAPHTDRYDTGVRAAELLLRIIRRRLDVRTVAARLPLLVCGENSMTDVYPMQQLIDRIHRVCRSRHVMNADYTLGFPWADTPRHGACALVSGETTHLAELAQTATALADEMWELRSAFVYSEEAYPLDEALAAAAGERSGLVIVSDTGDNPTAGAASDLTFVLERLLEQRAERVLVAVIADTAAYERCRAAGAGAELELALGRREALSAADTAGEGRTEGDGGEQRLRVTARILSVHDGLDTEGRSKQVCDAAVVRIGDVDVIIAERRIAVYDPTYLTLLGLDPAAYRLLVLKSGYLSPEYRRLAVRTIFALTPGQSNIVLRELRFTQNTQALYPIDPDASWDRAAELERLLGQVAALETAAYPAHAHEPVFAIPFSPVGYLQAGAHVIRRRLSQLRHLYEDAGAVDQLLAEGDPIVYEVYEMPYPYQATDLLINITVLYPGRVGAQWHMTKGHFHAEPDTAEAVIGLSGSGEMLLQRRDGELRRVPVGQGLISYAGGGWAHRVVNTGSQPLVFFAVSGADILHDYETAERLNFRTV